MMNVLIDTNIYSMAMRGDADVTDNLRKFDRIAFSVVSIGELFSGFKGGGKETKNREELIMFLDSPRVVVHDIDIETTDFYASIFNNLKAAGTPVPTNDIWIASVAFQYGYKLYSNDKHFNHIPGLLQIGN